MSISVSIPSMEHVGLGIIGEFREDASSGADFVQMGYWRGLSPTWNDVLGPNQVMIYMEYNRISRSTGYNWVPLLPVEQGTRHVFRVTRHTGGRYHNFYLDGNLKWANVYLDEIPNRGQIQNETVNHDNFCDGGYADVNSTVPSFTRMHVDVGHAVNWPGNPPWAGFAGTLERLLPSYYGYHCGQNANGYLWRCGPFDY